MTKTHEPLIKAIEAYLEKADKDMIETLESEGRPDPEDSVEAINNIEEAAEDALTKQTSFLLKEIKKHKSLAALLAAGVLDDIFARDKSCDAIRKAMSKELGVLIPKLTQSYVSVIDMDLKINAVSKKTLAWIDNWSADLANMMKITTQDTLTNMIKKSFEAGKDISSLTLDIMNNGIRDEYYRARSVAVTEVMRAHNVAKQEAAIQNPCITEKMWRHTGEHKNAPRENHVAMDGQRVPVDKPFTLVGMDGTTYYPMYPVDPLLPPEEAINCHCLSQDIVDENILGMPLEERQRLQQEALESMDAEWEQEMNERNKQKAGINE